MMRSHQRHVEAVVSSESPGLHVLFAKVHEHQAFVVLNHSVLETGVDAKLLSLHAQDKIRLVSSVKD